MYRTHQSTGVIHQIHEKYLWNYFTYWLARLTRKEQFLYMVNLV